eukprot:3532726-Alexandrium_andersonii.AAC.1
MATTAAATPSSTTTSSTRPGSARGRRSSASTCWAGLLRCRPPPSRGRRRLAMLTCRPAFCHRRARRRCS